MLKLPGFIAVEPEEYSRHMLEDEELALLDTDEQGAYSKDGLLRLSTSIRWRPVDGGVESNARLVKWSDGSMSLAVGQEQFEVLPQNIQKEHSYLFTRHAAEGCLEAVGKINERMAVRPFVTADQSHRKFLSLSNAASSVAVTDRVTKVKMAVTTADPEREKQRMIKLEQEKIKSKRKVEARRRNLQQRSYERVAKTGLSARFLEEDEGEGDDAEDGYEDDFIDDTGAASATEEEDSEEDTDFKSGDDDGGNDDEGSTASDESEVEGSDDESTAQESDESEESEGAAPQKRRKPAAKPAKAKKAAKIMDSDDD